MEQEIRQYNTNGQLNGYTELCIDKGCWLKGMFKNDNEVGYFIGDNGTEIKFYIR